MKRKITRKSINILMCMACLLLLLCVAMVACNKDKQQAEPPHEHQFAAVEAKDATCTENGNLLYYTCTCGKFFDENKQEVAQSDVIIAATGHTVVTDVGVPATCTDPGISTGSHCSVCKAVLVAQTQIPALGHDEVISSWESDDEYHWHKCTRCDAKLSKTAHVANDAWIDDSAPKCNAEGHRHKACECGKVMQEETLPTVPHDWTVSGGVKRCETCGISENIYERQGNAVFFGEYPQTKVEDNGTIATLSQMSGDNPSEENPGKWNSYGYYIGGAVTEYAWYMDITLDGVKYRGTYFRYRRPLDITYNEHVVGFNTSGYASMSLYWFKWEPLKWRILQEESGNLFLLSDVALDSSNFYHERTAQRVIDDKTIYPHNYKESDLRAWLNDAFLNWAFDDGDQSIIKDSFVDNSARLSGYYGSAPEGFRSQFMCDDTTDKVFLLARKEADNLISSDAERQLKATDYAQCQGVEIYSTTGACDWWLRTANDAFPPPGGDPPTPYSEHVVSYKGYTINTSYVSFTNVGVVPAINITAM